MNAEPAPTPATGTSSGEMPEAVAALRGDVGWESAMGILMALVPCTAEHTEHILAQAARTAGATPARTAAAVATLRTADTAVPPVLERALRAEVDAARGLPSYPAGVVLPPPVVLRQQLTHLRAARRRTLAAPTDPTLRTILANAAYTLCILMGERTVHAALTAAEERVALHRLGPATNPTPTS
ncbi:DUF5133 domain-containing protein [Streptomyces sp. NPDC051555]|uniref:DUF5133 domain-containing protein n=1 Tax=Streptomyces sp. NPDC051555 TaxID=3365657 RepID=UPI0037982391